MVPANRYQCFHFSLSNAKGPGQDDVSRLLRAMASSIEDLGDVTILDITFEQDVTTEGLWPSLTVYYDPE